MYLVKNVLIIIVISNFKIFFKKVLNDKMRKKMLTLKQADVQLEHKARVDSLCLILGQTVTES